MRTTASRLLAAHPDFLLTVYPVTAEEVSVQSAPWVLRRVWGRQTKAMTLGDRIFIDPSVLEGDIGRLERLIRHELIHARQWRDQGSIGFLSSYLRQYLIARLAGATHRQAYHAIDHEVEARTLSNTVL